MPVDAGRLLLVEDDPLLSRFVVHTLEEAGFAVDAATNGIEALKALQSEATLYAAVLLDLVLPWVNGLEVLAELRTRPATRHLPVLITTGTFVSPLQFAGMPRLSVLRKPFNQEQLIAAVELLLYKQAGA